MRIANALPLTPEDRRQLETWAKEKTAPARLVERARLLLLLADGVGIRPAARHLHVGFNTIRRWRDRFLEAGCLGIEHDAPGRGRKPVITDEGKAEIVRMTTQEKPHNATHWSLRRMADAAEVSPFVVWKIWKAHGLKPHLVRTFKVSNDPNAFGPTSRRPWLPRSRCHLPEGRGGRPREPGAPRRRCRGTLQASRDAQPGAGRGRGRAGRASQGDQVPEPPGRGWTRMAAARMAWVRAEWGYVLGASWGMWNLHRMRCRTTPRRQESGPSCRCLRPGPSRPGAAGDPRLGRGSAGRPRTRSARAAGTRSGPGPGQGESRPQPRLHSDGEPIPSGLLCAPCAALHALCFHAFGRMRRDAKFR